jgi:hypothetical protein
VAPWLSQPVVNDLNIDPSFDFSPAYATYLQDPFAPLESLFGSQSYMTPHTSGSESDTPFSRPSVTSNSQYAFSEYVVRTD